MRTCCAVCGETAFAFHPVLWPDLIRDWQLSSYEANYVDRQQGEACLSCGNNLRANALAKAISASFGFDGALTEFCATSLAQTLKVLEINRAANLTPVMARLPQHRLVEFPQVDMTRMDFADGEFDLVLHSDTLEHIQHPLTGLIECRRVLKNGGWCIFTVPVIVGRWSRSRQGLPPSFHGAAVTDANDLLVHTEFGADVWQRVLEAGFSNVSFHAVEYPAALAIAAKK